MYMCTCICVFQVGVMFQMLILAFISLTYRQAAFRCQQKQIPQVQPADRDDEMLNLANELEPMEAVQDEGAVSSLVKPLPQERPKEEEPEGQDDPCP